MGAFERRKNFDELVFLMLEEYDADEAEIKADAEEFIEVFREKGLLDG